MARRKVKSRPLKIGLTGQIGAGKSTVAALFKSKGAAIINADAIGKTVVADYPSLLRRLSKAFGGEILNEAGSLNRTKLAALAFTDAESTSKLNRLVHPYLLRELRRQIKGHSRNRRVIVVDAALLHLWRMERDMDLTLVIAAPRAVRITRMKHRGISKPDALKRDRAQLSLAEMKKRSDVVIRNSCSKRELAVKALRVWDKFIAPYIDS